MIGQIAGGDSISAQSVRSILAAANAAIPEPNAGSTAWSEWIARTPGGPLGNALAELAREDDEDGVADQVMPWLVRYFRDVAAAPDLQALSSPSTGGRAA